MLVSVYTKEVLMVAIQQPSPHAKTVNRQGKVAQIKDHVSGAVEGYNFFDISEDIAFDKDGVVHLSQEEVDMLNQLVDQASFEPSLTYDGRPSFVVAYVHECEKMEDSDHLNITQVEVDQGERLQIVCGAPNVKANQKVVVARPGTVMPDGSIIWEGQLRGTPSQGMICSAKELQLDQAPKKRGILELNDDYEVGQAFDI